MKNLILGAAVLAFSFSFNAQNQNVTEVSKTTVTTVKDSDGEKKLVKNQDIKEVQNIELQNAESKSLNKEVLNTPVQVTSSTVVTGPDGKTRTVDVDRSAYYSMGGNKYQVSLDNVGYSVMGSNGKREGVIRKTSNNNYVYKTKDRISFGHFDEKGDLILETYDDKADRFIVEKYTRN